MITKILSKLDDLNSRSKDLGFWRTTLFYIDKESNELKSRTIFSDHENDAYGFAFNLNKKYSTLNTPYYIFCTAKNSTYNGGLITFD